MRQLTRNRVESWWCEVFGIGDGLWESVSVLHPHRFLGDCPGWYVAWRAATANAASAGTARRLGFEPYATQLALSLDSPICGVASVTRRV